MKALSAEQSIFDGESELRELFSFIKANFGELTANEMEKTILSWVMRIGLSGMELYFAEKGTGDCGEVLMTESVELKKVSGLYGRDYFSVFGKVKVPRTCYRAEKAG